MREVEESRFVPAPPREVRRALTPAAVVEYEGSFDVREIETTDEGTTVTAGASGLRMQLAFEERDDGLAYRQEGEAGPFDAMETTVTVDAEDEGSRVTMRSAVSLGLPAEHVTDRIAAWKRRGELRRALDRLAGEH